MKVNRHSKRVKGFTLIELLAAMAIMAIMLSITIVSYYGFGRGARLRGSTNALRGKISLARQYAVVNSTETELRLGNPVDEQHYYYIYDSKNEYILGETNYLPTGVEFGELPDDGYIAFKPTGGSENAETYKIELIEDGQNRLIVEVYGLTGLVQVQ